MSSRWAGSLLFVSNPSRVVVLLVYRRYYYYCSLIKVFRKLLETLSFLLREARGRERKLRIPPTCLARFQEPTWMSSISSYMPIIYRNILPLLFPTSAAAAALQSSLSACIQDRLTEGSTWLIDISTTKPIIAQSFVAGCSLDYLQWIKMRTAARSPHRWGSFLSLKREASNFRPPTILG